MRKLNPKTLIEKYLRGGLNKKEILVLKRWLEANPGNSHILKEKARSWYVPKGEDADLDRSFAELREMIRQEKPVTEKSRRLLVRVSRIAAVLLIGLVIGHFMQPMVSGSLQKEAFYTVSADGGEKSRITLADGTLVWLNSESELKIYASSFSRERKVELRGEAYFEVKRDEKVPFIVKTSDYDIEVLGTEFNVMNYANFNRTETTLVNGSVKIEKEDKTYVLKPGQSLAYEDQQFVMKKTSVHQAVAWKDGQFYFDAIPLNELVMRLERWYDVSITIEEETLKSNLYSGVFRNEETIWQVLDVIEKTSPIHYEKKGFREIILKSKVE